MSEVTQVNKTSTTTAAAITGAQLSRKFLTFFLGEEAYGLGISSVHEIIGMLPVTRVPRTPQFSRGVINLRGKVIPIFDLRLKFNMEQQEATPQTCIIVVQIQGVQMGVIVDRVLEVLDIRAEDIDEPPSFGSGVNTDFLLGIGKSQGRVNLLLDIDHVLSTQELITIESVADQEVAKN